MAKNNQGEKHYFSAAGQYNENICQDATSKAPPRKYKIWLLHRFACLRNQIEL